MTGCGGGGGGGGIGCAVETQGYAVMCSEQVVKLQSGGIFFYFLFSWQGRWVPVRRR